MSHVYHGLTESHRRRYGIPTLWGDVPVWTGQEYHPPGQPNTPSPVLKSNWSEIVEAIGRDLRPLLANGTIAGVFVGVSRILSHLHRRESCSEQCVALRMSWCALA